MSQMSFKQFEKGDEVYFVSETAEKLEHLQGTLLEDITPETREIRLLNPEGKEIAVGSNHVPEWQQIEEFEGFGLLFLKEDADRVIYVVVSKDEDDVMFEPELDP